MREDADPKRVHRESIIIDAVCPLVLDDATYLDWYREGGVTALAPTVSTIEGARRTIDRLAAWHRRIADHDDLVLARTAGDIEGAKAEGRLALYFHMQGPDPIEDNLDLVHLFKAAGVGMIQLAYNVRNRAGDGCEEPSDAGLSRFGRALIDRLNEAKVIIDCSHTGLRTSLDAIERSRAPVVLSHSNLRAIHDSPRNVSDELVAAIARSGGVIGVVGFPAMVSSSAEPTLDEFVAHIDAIVTQVGVDHVALGLDYYWGQAGVASLEAATATYDAAVAAGIWSTSYPPPPHNYPAGIETPRTLGNLTAALLDRGYAASDVEKILGANWMRVIRRVWE